MRSNQKFTVAALYEDSELVEIYLEPMDTPSLIGNIYIGRVKDIVKNLNAAFIEIAPGQPCFFPLADLENPIFIKKSNSPKLVKGDELLVQVIKEGMNGKPPSVSTNLTFKGKYIVLTTGNQKLGVSKKLSMLKRQHLKQLFQAIKPDNFGIVVRTNSENVDDKKLQDEYERLLLQSQKVLKTSLHRTCYANILQQPPEYLNLLRNNYSNNIEQIIIDEKQLYDQTAAFLNQYQPTDISKLVWYDDPMIRLSKLYSLEIKLENALKERVWLKSGAYLIIQPTEALTVIDVNTGKSNGKKEAAIHYQKINIEAAKEVAHQLRLRNLSGIILIDFISMNSKEADTKLLNVLRDLTKNDPIPVQVVDMTKLHLVELTRKKVRKSIYEQVMLKNR
jgi:ribonuclease G